MNVKTLIQFFLFFSIILISFLVFKLYLLKKPDLTNIHEIEEKIVSGDFSKNIIEDLEYNSSDVRGNKYKLNAQFGEVDLENQNILILEDVVGRIDLINKSPIMIFSKYAEYNTITLDTKFYPQVKVTYEDNQITSDNLDLFFKDNIASMYNNINFTNYMSEAKTDKIDFDLLTGDINISMFDKTKKIEIVKK